MVGASVATSPIIGETIGALRGGEDGEGGGEDAGDHAAADEALHRPPQDHLVDRGRLAQSALAMVKPAAAMVKNTRVDSARLR